MTHTTTEPPLGGRKLFGRDPTLWLLALSAMITGVGTLNIDAFSPLTASLYVAAVNAVFWAVNAVTVRPIAPATFTYAAGAVIAILAHYGFSLDESQIGAVNAVLLTVLALITRATVNPVQTKISRA